MDANLRLVPAEPAEEADVLLETVPSFEEFYRGSFRQLFTALCLVTGNRHEAEEIAQDAFLRLYERWDWVATIEDPTGYLFRVAMNVFRSRYRRATLALRRAISLTPPQIDELGAVDARDELVRLLRGLEPRQRAAVVLTALLDYPAAEAGRMLGLRDSSVRSLTARARAQMKHEVVSDES